MTITDRRLDTLAFQRQVTIKRFDSKEISEEEYNSELKKYDVQMKDLQTELIVAEKKKQITNEEETKMEEEQAVIEKKKASGKKPNPNSYTMTIIKVLGIKGIKTIDEAIIKVDELKPGRDANKIKTQIKSIINLVKKQQGRWERYIWDQDQFLMTEKA